MKLKVSTKNIMNKGYTFVYNNKKNNNLTKPPVYLGMSSVNVMVSL